MSSVKTPKHPVLPGRSKLIHNLVGDLGYLLAPGLLLGLAWSSRTWPAATALRVVGFIAAPLALLGLLTLAPASPFAGLSQRAIELAVLGWVLACGWYVYGRDRVRAAGPGTTGPGAQA